MPSRGSLYSFDAEDSVNLARGHMLIIAGDISVNLTAGKMKVAIAPGASMVAEVEADGGTRLYSLASFERTHPAALIGPSPELGLADAVPVEPGQEVVISNNALNSDELIAADGLAVAPLEGSLKLVERTNGHMHLVSYSMKSMLDNEYLIGCKRISVPPSDRLSKLKEGLQTASDHEQQINTSKAGRAAENHNLPVSAITSESKNIAGQLIKLDDTLVVPESNAIYNVGGDGSINLLRGTILVRADKETVINAQNEKIVVAKGAVALVKAAEGTTKVTNLSDLASHSVRLIAQGRSIDLLPAREAIFSKAAPNLGHIFDVYQIGHHSIVSQPLENKGWITTSQIALMDELIYQPLLVAIRTDAKYADAKKAMVDQVMKTAAIFNTLHGRESYVRGEIEDQVTAYTVIADKGCASCNR